MFFDTCILYFYDCHLFAIRWLVTFNLLRWYGFCASVLHFRYRLHKSIVRRFKYLPAFFCGTTLIFGRSISVGIYQLWCLILHPHYVFASTKAMIRHFRNHWRWIQICRYSRGTLDLFSMHRAYFWRSHSPANRVRDFFAGWDFTILWKKLLELASHLVFQVGFSPGFIQTSSTFHHLNLVNNFTKIAKGFESSGAIPMQAHHADSLFELAFNCDELISVDRKRSAEYFSRLAAWDCPPLHLPSKQVCFLLYSDYFRIENVIYSKHDTTRLKTANTDILGWTSAL